MTVHYSKWYVLTDLTEPHDAEVTILVTEIKFSL
jgi:hypothetical protein